MVEMGGIEPPSNKPLLSRSFRKPKFAHNNAEDFNTVKPNLCTWCKDMLPIAEFQSLGVQLVEAAGIGLAGRAFACMRMPLRATNSTQVLFV